MPKKTPKPLAAKDVTGAYEEAGPYATIPRDEAELERGRALGPATTARLVYDIVRPALSKESQEVFLVIPLDLRGACLSRPVEVARGQRDHVTVEHSDIFRPVIAHNAKGFVVVHCHPSGKAKPSGADKRLTKSIAKATPRALGGSVKFVDHVIVACTVVKGEYFSFQDKQKKIHKVTH